MSRDKRFSLCLTEEESDRLFGLAQSSQRSASEWLRSAIAKGSSAAQVKDDCVQVRVTNCNRLGLNGPGNRCPFHVTDGTSAECRLQLDPVPKRLQGAQSHGLVSTSWAEGREIPRQGLDGIPEWCPLRRADAVVLLDEGGPLW